MVRRASKNKVEVALDFTLDASIIGEDEDAVDVVTNLIGEAGLSQFTPREMLAKLLTGDTHAAAEPKDASSDARSSDTSSSASR